MSDQLALFDEPDTRQPITVVQVCHECGQPVAGTPVADAAAPWGPAVLWGYVALRAHQAEQHGRPRAGADQ